MNTITPFFSGGSRPGLQNASVGKAIVRQGLTGDSVHFSGKNEEAEKKRRQKHLEVLVHHLNNDPDRYFDKIKKYYAWVHYKGGKAEQQKRQLELEEIEQDYSKKGPLYQAGVDLAKHNYKKVTQEDLDDAMIQPSALRWAKFNIQRPQWTEPLVDKLPSRARVQELKAILRHGDGEPYPKENENEHSLKRDLPYEPYEG